MLHLTQRLGKMAVAEAARGNARAFSAVSIGDTTVAFEAMLYADNTLALELHAMEEGRPVEPFSTLTVRVKNTDPMQSDEICVRLYGDNELFRTPMLASGLFADTRKRVAVGFAEVEIWQLTPDFVRAFIAAYPTFSAA